MYGKYKNCVLSLKPSHRQSNWRIISATGGCNTVNAKKKCGLCILSFSSIYPRRNAVFETSVSLQTGW